MITATSLPTRLNDRDCGWCGAVAVCGPYDKDGYDTDWYLCEHCQETVGGFEPTHDELAEHDQAVIVKIDGTVTARYPEGA